MKSPIPDTRESLIVRLGDQRDATAWDEFVAIYRPLIHRIARIQGLQDADAQEVSQEVLVAISRAIGNWEFDPGRGRFRTWLFQISRNLTLNYLSRRKHRSIGSGDSAVQSILQSVPNRAEADLQLYDIEYRREVFRWAANEVKKQVTTKQWQAFWLSSVELFPISEISERLTMTAGAIYIARSRVLARLRLVAEQFEQTSQTKEARDDQ